MKSRVSKLGNSQGVIIPKPLLEEAGLKAGDPVDMRVNKKGRLVIVPSRSEPRAGWADDSKALAAAGEAGQSWPVRAAADQGSKW